MPILWNDATYPKLANNYYDLACMILKSNLRRLSKNTLHLTMVDEVFQEQLKARVISPLNASDPRGVNYSFLAHMPIFKNE